VLLWFAGGSFAVVWQVFRDPAVDYRLVMVGAVLPDLLDGPFGGPRVMHTLLASVVLLLVVMVATGHRRARRRQLLALPIGTFLHLLLDGMWTRSHLFWWPFLGRHLTDRRLPSFDRPVGLIVAEELIGAALLLWLVRRFRLVDPDRRATFVRTGHLGRDLAGPPPTSGR
jgi:membrane-bound metal-dependent hydrolase YbcI (DUF457 family)